MGGAGVFLALYPVWFRIGFTVSHRGKVARVGGWVTAIALAVGWYLLVLDLFLFNTTLIVFPTLLVILAGVAFYLLLNRV